MTTNPRSLPDDDDDVTLAAMLRGIDVNAPVPDVELLATLRASSTQAFVTASQTDATQTDATQTDASSEDATQADTAETSPVQTAITTTLSDSTSHTTSRPPFGVLMKTLAALSAAVLMGVAFWMSSSPSLASTLTLGDVLEKLQEVDLMQLEVVRDGKTAQVWIRQPGLVRWEESPQKYGIARGSRFWQVDATQPDGAGDVGEGDVVSGDNPWFGDDGKIDLIAMLNIHPDDRDSLFRAEPEGSESFGGTSCWVYRRIVTGEGTRYLLEVYVDQESEHLLGITARDPDGVGRPPLAELTLIAMNPPIEDDKFRLPVKLAESDRIGKVTDTQGIVTLRPVGSRRWTPVCRQLLVQPGDWVRTDVRGANATTIELESKVTLVVGPNSLIELITPNEARLHSGTVQVARTKQSTNDFKLTGVQESDVMTFGEPGKKLVKLDRTEKLVDAVGKPVWLAGYEGSSAEDSIGSLIVNVDGREQSLSVGEHHVLVEIRDQIARTTIEETFVNHTNSRLEGQFHFPLPQDASISGFGMWINGELIEADIVEKQRAREIYETILREKRDPGLLEWTGGNIFKARVFPIEAHSEKRIKIVYTQVLPLRGNRFRYSYALKSELLQTNPLRDLNIRVLVNSAVPLAEVTSTTHTCRSQLTKHSAELEFTAQEYTPTRDFEVVCEVNHRENDLLVIPHRRGDDGYFLMQLMPPGAEGQWTREVIPDGTPLHVLLLCDTSGSMDSAMRKTQEQFVTTLLSSLGDKDRFTLATTDVETQWAFDEFVSNDAANITKARDFLDARISLGWTDLDQAFAAVLKRAQPGCQIVYIGDGIVSTVENDPAAFVGRLKLLNEQQGPQSGAKGPEPATFHAVSVGSAYESIVLKGIASLGGGSTRQISGETTPQETALELLNEISQPGLKNVNVEFRGLKVAAVYPEQLPNIAAGTQQILVGRYLPTGEQQRGEVVVTGLLNGEPVKYVSKIELANAEAGNSFIPRLWARGRLDSLLQEGSTPAIQEEIIGLSEEFHIITPYTSLLVLETDADRERFGVKRRFEMRDGERFFAEGRDNANYELRQQQMQRAGNWRLGLRRQLLAELVGLGRDIEVFHGGRRQHEPEFRQLESLSLATASRAKKEGQVREVVQFYDNGAIDMPVVTWDTSDFSANVLSKLESDADRDGTWNGIVTDENGLDFGLSQVLSAEMKQLDESPAYGSSSSFSPYDGYDAGKSREIRLATYELAAREFGGFPVDAKDKLNQLFEGRGIIEEFEQKLGLVINQTTTIDSVEFAGEPAPGESDDLMALVRAPQSQGFFGRSPEEPLASELRVVGRKSSGGNVLWQEQQNRHQSIAWVSRYFPGLPRAPRPDAASSQPSKKSTGAGQWSDEAIALSESLLREAVLRELPGGLEIERNVSGFNGDFGRLVADSSRLELWSKARWLTRDSGMGKQSLVNWLDAEQRGVYSEAFLLGRSRASAPSEFDTLPLQLSDFSLSKLHETYRNYHTTVERPEPTRAVLHCRYGHNNTNEARFTIDTERHVLLKHETIEAGKVTSTDTYSEFVNVAGVWWATRIETTSADRPEQVNYLVTQTIKEHPADTFQKQFETHRSLAADTYFLQSPLPTVRQAKQAVREGTAEAADRFILMLHFSLSQKWEDVFNELRAWEALVNPPALAGKKESPKSGTAWVRIAVELAAARNEEARQHLAAQADEVVTERKPQARFAHAWQGNDLFLAAQTLEQLYPILGWNEYGDVVQKLQPVYQRQQDAIVTMYDWKTRWRQVLDSLGRPREALDLHRQLLDDAPNSVGLRTQYAGRLNTLQRPDEALTFLKAEIARDQHWDESQRGTLRSSYADILEGRGRYAEVLPFYVDWLQVETTHSHLFQRYLTALVMNDKVEEAETTVKTWLKLVEQPGNLSHRDSGKFYAANSFCLGHGYNMHRYYGMDRKWLPTLFEAYRRCLQREDRYSIIANVVQNQSIMQSDEGDLFRGEVLALLIDPNNHVAIIEDKPHEPGSETAPLTFPISQERFFSLIDALQGGRLLIVDGDAMQIRQVTSEEWQTLADVLLKWWETTPNDEQKHQLSVRLNALHESYLVDRQLPFLRRRIVEGPKDFEQTYRQELFDFLLTQPWTEPLETELFALWATLSPTEWQGSDGKQVPMPESLRAMRLVPQLYRLVDTMLKNRIAAAQQALQDKGDVDAATRTERTKSAADIVREAREGLADRLQKEWEARGLDESPLPHWLRAEKLYLDMLLDRNKGEVLQWAWAELGDAPPKFVPPVKKDTDEPVDREDVPPNPPQPLTEAQRVDRHVTAQLSELLKQRAWVTLMNLASRKSANEKLIQRVLGYIDAGIQSGEEASVFVNEELRRRDPDVEVQVDFTLGWREAKSKALILFDRPEELMTSLQQWIAKDKWNLPWRRSLAKLLAEQGNLADAITQMETVQKEDELTYEETAFLANWYLVVDNKRAYEASRIATFKKMQEWQLQQLLNQKVNQLQNGPGPHELDDETLFATMALMEKASYPANYYWTLHSLYTSTRDFRMLEAIPESMLGRTREAVYNAISNLQSSLLVEVRDEATADEILKHVHRLRDQINAGWVPRGADPNVRSQALDLRALDLLESMIERKASEVVNQPGPHGKAALLCFQRAFDRGWQTGEPLQYAQFLQQIGAVTHERDNPVLTPLADEQLRQIKQLYDDSTPGENDRVRIGLAHAQLLFHGYNKQQEGLVLSEAALNEFAAAHGGLVPYSHNDLVTTYSSMLQQVSRYVRAEQYVQKHLDQLTQEGERWTYEEHLNQLHQQALFQKGQTSLGTGEELLDNLVQRLTDQCDTQDDGRRYQSLIMIANVYRYVINNQKDIIPTAGDKLIHFANKVLPELLEPQQNNYSSIIHQFVSALHEVSDLEAFSFLLDRLETYPPRFEYGYQQAWLQHGQHLAQYRFQSASLTSPTGKKPDQLDRHQALEARLLPIVLSELKQDLWNLRERNQAFYHNNYAYFWAAKAGDFLKVAEQVLKDRYDSPRTQTYVAEYLFHGLDQYDRAIEVLFVAHRRGLLDDEGQLQLVGYLHNRKRYAESISLLEPLVDRRPDEMHLRVLLLRSYYFGQRPEQLATLTAATDAHFHQEGRWVESNIIEFARVLAETQQDQRSVECFEEAISLHQNTQPGRGIGTGTLSYYYQEVSAVYSRLGDDEKAVDAAAGGVVSWGNDQNGRRDALNQLEATIGAVRNLDRFTKSLDDKLNKTGEDSPLLRKYAGKVLQGRKEYLAAIQQYRASLELQPYDRDVHQWVIECFDELKDTAGATQQLLAQIDFDRHSEALYKSLVEHTIENPLLAERAATSIIEQAPSEAESYHALAELRESQNRWQEAIPLWKRVAELRKEEPTGLINLAEAQLHVKDFPAAQQTLNTLRKTVWHERFGEVIKQSQKLEAQLP